MWRSHSAMSEYHIYEWVWWWWTEGAELWNLTCIPFTEHNLTCIPFTEHNLTCIPFTEHNLTCIPFTEHNLTCIPFTEHNFIFYLLTPFSNMGPVYWLYFGSDCCIIFLTYNILPFVGGCIRCVFSVHGADCCTYLVFLVALTGYLLKCVSFLSLYHAHLLVLLSRI